MTGLSRIGPYSLSRTDLVTASVIISFRIGGRRTRVMWWTLSVLCLLLLASGALTGDWMPGIVATVTATYLVAGVPLLRSRRGFGDLFIEVDPDGIVAENAGTRTLYKWATVRIGAHTKTRLFVMVTPNCALVVPSRATPPENLALLIAAIHDNEAAA